MSGVVSQMFTMGGRIQINCVKDQNLNASKYLLIVYANSFTNNTACMPHKKRGKQYVDLVSLSCPRTAMSVHDTVKSVGLSF